VAKDTPKTFQMLPVAHWWTLRERFKQSMPGIVTDNYLATALNMQPGSAQVNVLPYLKDIGLIDNNGKTQKLAKAWRDDNQYADVCMKMREKLYPAELRDSVPNPSEDRNAVERWFANHTGVGSGAVKRMAAIYVVISEADISKKPDKPITRESRGIKKKTMAKSVSQSNSARLTPTTPKPLAQTPPAVFPNPTPGLNINLEIHISADATPDQIDKIFESMAKHIYKK